MQFGNGISALTVIVALAASSSAMAQVLELDADVGLGEEPAVEADVDLGVGGPDGLETEADVEVTDDVDATLDVDLGGEGSSDAQSGLSVNTEANLLEEEAVDANATIGIGSGTAVDGTIRLLSLSEQDAQVDLMVDLIGDTSLAEIDLDAVVDDQQVRVVDLDEIFEADAVAEIEAAIVANATAQENLREAVAASAELTAILENEALAPEAVVALQVAADGATDIFVDEDNGTATFAALSLGLSGDGGPTGAPVSATGDGDDASADNGEGNPDAAGDAGAAVESTTDNGDGADLGAQTDGNGIVVDFANLDCPAGIDAMLSASDLSSLTLASISEVSVVAVSGCPSGTATAPDALQLREAIRAEQDLLRAIQAQGVSVDAVIGGVSQDDTLVLYVAASTRA